MPLERSDAILDLSDPNTVLGPRKRRPTERILENGDPLACKRVRKAQASTAMTISNACADEQDHTLSLMSPPTHLTSATCTTPTPRQATNHTNSNNDSTSDGPQAIVVEDSDGSEGSDEGEVTDEDDDAELGMCSIGLFYFW